MGKTILYKLVHTKMLKNAFLMTCVKVVTNSLKLKKKKILNSQIRQCVCLLYVNILYIFV